MLKVAKAMAAVEAVRLDLGVQLLRARSDEPTIEELKFKSQPLKQGAAASEA